MPSGCVVCMEKEAEYLGRKCPHKCLCKECGTKILEKGDGLCPLCRLPLKRLVKVIESGEELDDVENAVLVPPQEIRPNTHNPTQEELRKACDQVREVLPGRNRDEIAKLLPKYGMNVDDLVYALSDRGDPGHSTNTQAVSASRAEDVFGHLSIISPIFPTIPQSYIIEKLHANGMNVNETIRQLAGENKQQDKDSVQHQVQRIRQIFPYVPSGVATRLLVQMKSEEAVLRFLAESGGNVQLTTLEKVQIVQETCPRAFSSDIIKFFSTVPAGDNDIDTAIRHFCGK